MGLCARLRVQASSQFSGCCPAKASLLGSLMPFSAPAFESDRGLPVPWSLIVQGEELLKAFPRVRRGHPVPSKLWSFHTCLFYPLICVTSLYLAPCGPPNALLAKKVLSLGCFCSWASGRIMVGSLFSQASTQEAFSVSSLHFFPTPSALVPLDIGDLLLTLPLL